MYRTLTNPKLLRGLTHSGFMFDDIICDFYCPLLNVIFHKNNPCINCFLQSMQGVEDVCLNYKTLQNPIHSLHANNTLQFQFILILLIILKKLFIQHLLDLTPQIAHSHLRAFRFLSQLFSFPLTKPEFHTILAFQLM